MTSAAANADNIYCLHYERNVVTPDVILGAAFVYKQLDALYYFQYYSNNSVIHSNLAPSCITDLDNALLSPQ